MDEFDIVIAGGGVAGLTAALFAARLGRSTLAVTGPTPGGQLLSIDRIDGLPGFPDGVPGYDLGPIAQEQAAAAGAAFSGAEVEEITSADGAWLVRTSDGDVRARAVVVATGSRFRELGVPGEERLRGHGVSDCASCDGPLLRGRAVAVVGGGDSGLQEVLTLVESVAEVVVIERGSALTGQEDYRRRVLEHGQIAVRYGTEVEEILGEDRVAGLRVRDVATGATEDLELAAVFPFVGLQPNGGLLAGLVESGPEGGIPTDARMRTSLPGLFAAGTVRDGSECQAASSAGDGATAAKAAHRFLDDGVWPTPVATAATATGG
jgi:thioredoxin reductase (NADPH)